MLPLSLYIHIPWCIQKCFYCDFNSHAKQNTLPEKEYLQMLIADLAQDVAQYGRHTIKSIFIGGGTPSLLSASFYNELFAQINELCTLPTNIEITLEANPGTIEHGLFSDYRAVGINRLSLGIQSFNDKHLHKLGRIHNQKQAIQAVESVRKAGFNNFNLDIMHSLPEQTLQESLDDLKKAISLNPQHLSWYQLTIEPNTLFYKVKPKLPADDLIAEIEEQGLELLSTAGFKRYEISAFTQHGFECQHNLNYWLFGDYLGIGAGAHAKFTNVQKQKVSRTNKYRLPRDYMQISKGFIAGNRDISGSELIFEFMLNTTRLAQRIPTSLFTNTTLLPYNSIVNKLQRAVDLGLIDLQKDYWQVTDFGRRYTNNLQEIFLP